jgi:hypothetical protein
MIHMFLIISPTLSTVQQDILEYRTVTFLQTDYWKIEYWSVEVEKLADNGISQQGFNLSGMEITKNYRLPNAQDNVQSYILMGPYNMVL